MEASFIVPILLFFLLFVAPGEDTAKNGKGPIPYRRVATGRYYREEPKSVKTQRSLSLSKGASQQIKVKKTKKKKPIIPEGDIVDDLDYRTIYKYIKSTYKKVPPNDAHLIAKYLVEMGKEHQLDPKFVAAVMAKESGFNRRAISSTGAKGLGQIKDFNYKSLDIKDPYNIKQNARGTVKYLKRMMSKWKGKKDKTSLALASYYQGYGTISRSGGKYNRDAAGYVNGILKYYDNIKKIRKKYDE